MMRVHEVIIFVVLNIALLVWGTIGINFVLGEDSFIGRIRGMAIYVGIQFALAAVTIGLVLSWDW